MTSTLRAPMPMDAGAVVPAFPRGARFWIGYWAFWLLIGVSLALAELQNPNHPIDRRAWEPFLLEVTSLLSSGLLALLVYRWVARVQHAGWSWPGWLLAHLTGAAVFAVLHVATMYALRWPVYYLITGRSYAPMSAAAALGFEGAKDLVSYVVIAGLSYALQLRQREQQHRLDLQRSQAAMLELQLLRLSHQLQPHFLFNCLNAVSSMIEENPRAAVKMVARIGDYLRGAMQTDGSALTDLRSELALARDYLAIQSLRFEGALQLHFEIPAELEALAVPRLVLQPLVENAVKHGMASPGTTLQVTLRAQRRGDRLVISVLNDHAPVDAAAAGPGRGLELVRERLSLHYGGQATLRTTHTAPDRFCTTVELPATTMPGPAA